MSITVKSTNKINLTKHPLYTSWYKMMYRCYGERYEKKHRYVLRGIIVCDEWHDITNFIKDMNPTHIVGYTLDRRDNDTGYCKDNCQWVTRAENSTKDKTIRVVKYTLNGVFIDEYSSCAAVNVTIGLKFNHGGLNRAIKQKKPFKGFRWAQSSSNDNLPPEDMVGKLINTNVPILQLDSITGVVIKQWTNAKEIVNTLNINSGSLSRVCSGKLNSTGGFKWKHLNNPNIEG